MSVNKEAYQKIKAECGAAGVTLVAVSKTKPVEDVLALYDLGHRDFGENYVQELTSKYEALPKDIRWHFIGHLQSNKVKYIAPFVHLIHGIDSEKLLTEINKQAVKNSTVIKCLLQVHIAMEETKFGLDEQELQEILTGAVLPQLDRIKVTGLMGMASFSDDLEIVRNEFKFLHDLLEKSRHISSKNIEMDICSMGMSADYTIAIQEGSTMIRVGSLLFGSRI